jgi:hypothetical protein
MHQRVSIKQIHATLQLQLLEVELCKNHTAYLHTPLGGVETLEQYLA